MKSCPSKLRTILKTAAALLVMTAILMNFSTFQLDSKAADYKSVYLSYAALADENADNLLTGDASGFIMMDFNNDSVPEIITYSTIVQKYDDLGNKMYLGDEGYFSATIEKYEYSLSYGFSIVDGKVKEFSPWRGYSIYANYLPGENNATGEPFTKIVEYKGANAIAICYHSEDIGEKRHLVWYDPEKDEFAYKSLKEEEINSLNEVNKGVAHIDFYDEETEKMRNSYEAMELLIDAYELSKAEFPTTVVNPPEEITVYLNGEKIQFDVLPIIENGRTLVPLRAIFEAMDMTVEWDDESGSVIAWNDYHTMILPIGETRVTVDGKECILDVPAKIIDGRTLVPVRFVSESVGAHVDWNQMKQRVDITYNTASLFTDKFVVSSVEDCDEARKYDSITYLKIDHANLEDFSFMEGIDIKLLQVIANEYPVDMQYVNTLSIEKLSFANAVPINTNVLEKAEGLNYIEYNYSFLADVETDYIKSCHNLETLIMKRCNVSDLSFLEGKTKLDTFTIEEGAVEDVTPLKSCKNLTTLTIDGCKVRDLTPLKGLDKLYMLSLNNNYITDITPLKGILGTNLKYLYLSQNFITDCSVFNSSQVYQGVNLGKNYITTFPDNMLKDGVSIDLSSNNIEQIPKSTMEKIKNSNVFINLHDNLLTDETVSELGDLDTVYFEGEGIFLQPDEELKFNQRIREILSLCNHGDEKEIAVRIFEYISDNSRIDYTYENEQKDSAYGALFSEAVCTGFTDLADSLLRHSGIYTKVYHGDFQNPNDYERHVWNNMFIGDSIYHADAMMGADNNNKDEYGITEIVLMSDEEIKERGHILDAPNMYPCEKGIGEDERERIVKNIVGY